MVALNEKLLSVGDVLMDCWGGIRVSRWRTTQNATPEELAALRPTIYVPLRRGENLTYAEVVARKV